MIDASTFRLDGQLALVTGSSSGIGLALARGLGQAGAALVLNGRDTAKLAAAAQTLRSEGLTTHVSDFDVTDGPAAAAAIAQIEAGIGPIGVLVNNAGVQRRGAFQDISADDWTTVMRSNVDSLFHVGQAVARHMLVRGRGKIINICSVHSTLGRAGVAPYTASKGAVKMLTQAMAIDLGPHGLHVNGLAPGYFKTALTQSLADDPAFNGWLIPHTPCRRWGEVDDLAPAAVFLASDASRFVNGHILYVDGGITASL